MEIRKLRTFGHDARCVESLVTGLVALLVLAGCSGPTGPEGPSQVDPDDLPQPDVTVRVDGSVIHQTIVGFGGDFAPWHLSSLRPEAQVRLVEALVQEMGIHSFRMNLRAYEGVSVDDRWGENDNDDPFDFDWSTFDFCRVPVEGCNEDWAELIPALRGAGAAGLYWGLIQGPRWNGFDGQSAFSVDEMVENQLAAFRYLREEHGLEIGWLAPFSEPSGGGIDWPISADQARQVVRRLGQRLEAAGFTDVRLVVPDAVSPGASVEYARAILDDPDARRHVAAVGYHAYRSGPGGESPSAGWRNSRGGVRSVGEEFGLPVRMTEFANLNGLMERANHIFNEFEFAGSQTYHPQHVVSTGGHEEGGSVRTEGGGIVFFIPGGDGELQEWGPTRYTGVAIGHYSLFVPPDAVRVGVEGSPSDLRVQAFRVDAPDRLALVLVNNGTARRVQIELVNGLEREGGVEGVVTREGDDTEYWTDVGEVLASGANVLSLEIPGRSVTSLRLER